MKCPNCKSDPLTVVGSISIPITGKFDGDKLIIEEDDDDLAGTQIFVVCENCCEEIPQNIITQWDWKEDKTKSQKIMEKQKSLDVMTQGFQEALAECAEVAKWAAEALKRINRKGGYPDFIVGRNNVKAEKLEDKGRTLVLPLAYYRHCYCAINETGGTTLMLADEH